MFERSSFVTASSLNWRRGDAGILVSRKGIAIRLRYVGQAKVVGEDARRCGEVQRA